MADNVCTKCEGTLDSTGYPLWCMKCRAQHKREYDRTRKEMTESRGYAAGCSAMRSYLAQRFAQYGTAGAFTGSEIAQIIARAQGPPA